VIWSQPLAKSRPESLRMTNTFQKLNNFEDGTFPMYQYTVHKLEFVLPEALNLYLILPNVISPVSPPSISLIWF